MTKRARGETVENYRIEPSALAHDHAAEPSDRDARNTPRSRHTHIWTGGAPSCSVESSSTGAIGGGYFSRTSFGATRKLVAHYRGPLTRLDLAGVPHAALDRR